MLTRTEELFFELLRIALGTQETLTTTLTDNEWLEVSQMAVKQSVLGILYSAVEKLPEAQRPPTDLYIDMYQCVQEIEDRNRHLNKMTALVSSRFRKDGFPNCILKGQGIALLYPNPLRRQSGDIDIWLKGERNEILQYVNNITKDAKSSYHQIKFSLKDGTLVEAHYTPSVSYNPFTNKRLQHWLKERQPEQIRNYCTVNEGNAQISVPTHEFNAVYMLHHSFRHLLSERLLMKQVIDYFYVLKNLNIQNIPDDAIADIKAGIKTIGMVKFSAALSWLLVQKLGLSKDLIITPIKEKEGIFLAKYIMGTSDKNVDDDITQFSKDFNNAKPFFTTYPNEALWYPLLSIGSTIWHTMKRDRRSSL